MWPFKRKPEPTMAEIFADKPEPRCGNKERHYGFLVVGMKCPVCYGIEKREREARERAALAKLIAAELAPVLITALSQKGAKHD